MRKSFFSSSDVPPGLRTRHTSESIGTSTTMCCHEDRMWLADVNVNFLHVWIRLSIENEYDFCFPVMN